MELENGGHELSQQKLSALEVRLGFDLPSEYRSFLLQHNGGRPVRNRFEFNDDKSDSMVNHFFSLGKRGASGLEFNLEVLDGRVPEDLLPIAADPFGNIICLGLKGERRGVVYFWDHERESRDDPPDYQNVTRIADSFSDFWEMLHEK